MTREESTKIVDKIQIHRQSFLVTQKVYLEWYRILEPYDFSDVDKQLDNYFKDSSNFGRYPDAYYLVKYLKTEEEKERLGEWTVRCSICGKVLSFDDYDNHFERCLSVDYIKTKRLKYFNKSTNREKLMALPRREFDQLYMKLIEQIYDLEENPIEKHNLKNVILTSRGFEPEFGIKEILESIS